MSPTADSLAIETQALTKRFGALAAVDEVSFAVREGVSFALLGPNGAGKSTLIRLLTTLLLPTSGRARVGGHDVVADPDGVRRAIGVVPQAVTSDPKLTAAENLEFAGRLRRIPRAERAARVESLLALVDLLEWRDELVGTFSGGMRRRVEIASSLMHEPRILFLDEPTSGLDPASRLALWAMLGAMRRQRPLTLLLTTHYMEEAEQGCDRVAVVDRGRIVVQGTPRELEEQLPATQSIEVGFAAEPPGFGDVLGRLPGVEALAALDGGGWRLSVSDRTAAVAALGQVATAHGLTLRTIRSTEKTLQDVFIHWTGRDVRDTTSKLRLDRRLLHQG
jgi:ABC-2 type transport system ATP-binding protein